MNPSFETPTITICDVIAVQSILLDYNMEDTEGSNFYNHDEHGPKFQFEAKQA